MIETGVQRVLSAIAAKGGTTKLERGEHRTNCPAHDDNKASMMIRQGTKGAIVFCHAGCSATAIMAELGMTTRDLFDAEPQKQGGMDIERAYDYQDETGKLVYQVVRMQGKEFRQRRPQGDKWAWNLQGVERIPYRLPELLKGVQEGQVVFVVEGEKDADRLRADGLVATCNPGGAGKFLPSMAGYFSQADVVILPDNDQSGRQHAQDVLRILEGVARSVKILKLPGLPDKGDVSDWYAKGGTPEALLALVGDVEPAYVEPRPVIEQADKLVEREFRCPHFPVEGWIPEGFVILAGSPKVGKSWLSLQIALDVAAGNKTMGDVATEQGEVLYLAMEDTPRRLKNRIRMQIGPFTTPPSGLHLATEWPRLDRGGLEWVENWLKEHPDARMVVLDTLAKVRPDENGNAYQDDYRVGASLKRLGDKYGVSIIAVHHRRKADDSDPQNTVSGTTGLTGAADATIVIRRARNEDVGTLWITGRDVEEREEAIQFDGDSGTWTVLGDAEEYRTLSSYDKILAFIGEQDEPVGPKEVADALDMPVGTAKWLLPELVKKGVIEKISRGKYGPKAPGSSPEAETLPPGKLKDEIGPIPDSVEDLFGPDEYGEA